MITDDVIGCAYNVLGGISYLWAYYLTSSSNAEKIKDYIIHGKVKFFLKQIILSINVHYHHKQ